MATARRSSPLAHALATLHPEWIEVAGMPLAAKLRDDHPARSATLGICDLSALPRIGLKGPGAAGWLSARGVPVPDQPNTWSALEGGGAVARLARTEFLVEDGFSGGTVAQLAPELKPGSPGVYPVPRQDCALALTGSLVNELLVQTCNVDFIGHRVAATLGGNRLLAPVVRRHLGPLPVGNVDGYRRGTGRRCRRIRSRVPGRATSEPPMIHRNRRGR